MKKNDDKYIYLLGYDDTFVGYAFNKKDAKEAADKRGYSVVKVKRNKKGIKEIIENNELDTRTLVHSLGGVLMFYDEEDEMVQAFDQHQMDIIRYMSDMIESLNKMKFKNKKEKEAASYLKEIMEYHIMAYQEDNIYDDEYYYNWKSITEWYIENVIKPERS